MCPLANRNSPAPLAAMRYFFPTVEFNIRHKLIIRYYFPFKNRDRLKCRPQY